MLSFFTIIFLKLKKRETQRFFFFFFVIARAGARRVCSGKTRKEWRRQQQQQPGTEPKWEATLLVTSRGSDKLVVPEEKMADCEEPISDEEKVRCSFHREKSPNRKLHAPNLRCTRLPASFRPKSERRRLIRSRSQASARRLLLLLLLFLAQLPLVCESRNGGSLYGPDSE